MIDQPLRVAMIAPPWFELPPPAYGGIEAMCADLIEELIVRGARVTLVGTGRNGTRARFVRTYTRPQGHRIGEALPEALHAAAVPTILSHLKVDVVHDHTLIGPLLAGAHRLPTVVTAHGPVTGELAHYYRRICDSVALVAISEAQRTAAPALRWSGMVHNAVQVAEFPFRADKDDYALFLGRLSPDKGLHLAIEAAAEAGLRLVVAAKCQEPAERDYFRRQIAPRLHDGVEMLGEVKRDRKLDLLASARCLLFPICWEEPFGIVMIEAMACGTPVVALRRGSVSEVLTHGETGFICNNPAQLAPALRMVERLSPDRCRAEVANRFGAAGMAAGYEQIYRSAICPTRQLPSRAG
jgi:glycosyltransferase involved in cell wall biosynthesis